MDKMIPVIYNGEKILTTEQLSQIYETSIDNIKKNFNNNKGRFEKGKHYYYLEGSKLKDFKRYVNNIHLPINKFTPHLYLWTERGADRHCKILDTDMAWKQFDNLENTYFKVKESKEELKLYNKLKIKIEDMEGRVKELEDNRTIDYSKQEELRNLGKLKVVSVLGGKDSPAYKDKHIRSKTFCSLWGEYKGKLVVNSYKNTAIKDFEIGRGFLANWKPPQELKEQIEIKNSQMTFTI